MVEIASKKGRLRFGMRSMLVLIAVCAVVFLVYSWLPNRVTKSELGRLRKGMTKSEVIKTLGQPDRTGYDELGLEVWDYGFLGVKIVFDQDDKYSETDIFKRL